MVVVISFELFKENETKFIMYFMISFVCYFINVLLLVLILLLCLRLLKLLSLYSWYLNNPRYYVTIRYP